MCDKAPFSEIGLPKGLISGPSFEKKEKYNFLNLVKAPFGEIDIGSYIIESLTAYSHWIQGWKKILQNLGAFLCHSVLFCAIFGSFAEHFSQV